MKYRLTQSSSQESFIGSLFAPGKIRHDRGQTRKVISELINETNNNSVKNGRIKIPLMQGPYNFEKSKNVPLQTLITKIKERREINSKHRQKDVAKRGLFEIRQYPKPVGGFAFHHDSRYKKLVFIQPEIISKQSGTTVLDKENAQRLGQLQDIKGLQEKNISLSKKQFEFNLTPNRLKNLWTLNRPWERQVPNFKLERQRWLKMEEQSFASETKFKNTLPLPSIKPECKDSNNIKNVTVGYDYNFLAHEEINITSIDKMKIEHAKTHPVPPVLKLCSKLRENVSDTITVTKRFDDLRKEANFNFVVNNNAVDIQKYVRNQLPKNKKLVKIKSIERDFNSSIDFKSKKSQKIQPRIKSITKEEDNLEQNKKNAAKVNTSQDEFYQKQHDKIDFDYKSDIIDHFYAGDIKNVEDNKIITNLEQSQDLKTNLRDLMFTSTNSGINYLSRCSSIIEKRSGNGTQQENTLINHEKTNNINGIYDVDWASQTGYIYSFH